MNLLKTLIPFAFLACAIVGCEGDYRPSAIGDPGSLVVVMDSTNWNGAPGEAVRNVFQDPILTLPAWEPSFSVRHTDLNSINQFETYIKNRKFILFAGTLNDSTNVSRFLQTRLEDPVIEAIRSGSQDGVFQLEDPWLRKQLVMYVAAPTADDLAETIERNGETLRYNLNEMNREETSVEMFSQLRQTDLEENLLEHHDFAVNVQHDYLVAIDTTDFVWMRRFVDQSNWRSFYIYYMDNADPTVLSPEWIYQARDRLTTTYMEGNLGGFPEIDRRRPLETENIDFLGRYGFETRGLWHMVGYDEEGNQVPYGGGGPFLTYTFYDEPQGRIYMIDGYIFAPNFDKRELLRQIEAIAYSFRTREEVEQAEAEASAVAQN